MLLTENEARKRECPLAGIAAIFHLAAQEKPIIQDSTYRCQASKCMAWRWRNDNNTPFYGWCGLAKKPE